MSVAWGLVVIVSSMLAWGGQLLSWLAPDLAVRLGLTESDSVDRTFWLDLRAEAGWDSFILWSMPLAGVLLLADHDWWRYFGLIGGGSFLYFAGRGMFVRVTMRRHQVPIGSASDVRAGLVALAVWGVIAIVTIVASIASLEQAAGSA